MKTLGSILAVLAGVEFLFGDPLMGGIFLIAAVICFASVANRKTQDRDTPSARSSAVRYDPANTLPSKSKRPPSGVHYP